MEPLNDDELRGLLRRWQAPPTPPSLELKLFPPRQKWWRWLLTGSIRVPVPLGVLTVVALAVLVFFSIQDRQTVSGPAREVNFSEFQPVTELKPRIFRSVYENN